MKKNNARMLAIWGILLALYNLISFVVQFEHNTVFWLSYGFSLAAFAVLFASWYFGDFKGDNTRSKFYGLPILKIGVTYFVVQIFAGWVVMTVKTVPTRVAIIVYAVALVVTVVGIIGADAVRDEIQTKDNKLKKNVNSMRSLQSQANQLVGQANGEAKKSLQKLAENLRYSDPVSSEMSRDAEIDLMALLTDLQAAVVDNDEVSVIALCRKAEAVLTERNRLCKLGK